MNKFFCLLIVVSAIYTATFCSCGSETTDNQIDSLNAILDEYVKRDSMQSSLLISYDKHLSQFGNIQDSIEHFQKSIDSLKVVIRKNGKATGAQNKELQAYINQIRSYISQNEELAQELQESGYKNASMTKLVKLMFASIEDKQTQLKQTQNEILELKTKVHGLETKVNDLTQENTELTTTVSDLTNKVSIITGSIKVIQPKERKAKKIQSLNIVCRLKANPDAPKGAINIYFRITDEGGNLLQNPEGDFEYGGKQIAYTVKTTVDYQGSEISKNVTWNKTTQNLSAGKYTVDFFIENRKEGHDTFVLDK
ncbi:MAG: hypothetical protein IIU11_09465 [Bacteroidales bacterium]|nr:hypothetical protein [Bacteroidales bacterium]